MNKDYVDSIILEYLEKIYGFSLSQTKDINLAEELSATIVFEVYNSLLKVENIHNVNSYIYRIASNVSTRFLIKERSHNFFSYNEEQKPTENESGNDNTLEIIRKEISMLSKLHREIVLMHYYEKMKLTEIAKKLSLPQGTVRWHIFEARKQMKESFIERKKIGSNNKQVVFSSLKPWGRISLQGIDLSFYFPDKLSKNVVYSVYHESKTVTEIARELDVPVDFVENEITLLLENGFVEKETNNKYSANMFIHDIKPEIRKKMNEVSKKYANIICDLYIPIIFELFKNIKQSDFSSKFYTPQNDFNFLMWSIISYSCLKKLARFTDNNDLLKYTVQRNDGGKNIATAKILNESLHINENYDKVCDWNAETKLKNNKTIKTWLFLSRHDDRIDADCDNSLKIARLFGTLYNFINNMLDKNNENLDKFISLYEEGFLISRKEKDIVNVVITTFTEKELIYFLPPMTETLQNIGVDFDNEIYNICKNQFPINKQNLFYIFNQNRLSGGLTRIFVLDILLNKGILKPLKKQQKKTVNMIMFSDVLPDASQTVGN